MKFLESMRHDRTRLSLGSLKKLEFEKGRMGESPFLKTKTPIIDNNETIAQPCKILATKTAGDDLLLQEAPPQFL